MGQPSRRGRGLIISGSVLIVVSIVAGIAAAVVFFAGFDVSQFTRDVSISGPSDRLVPGEISFRVTDSGGSGDMRVAIALSDVPTPEPDCVIVDGGRSIVLDPVRVDDEFVDVSGRYVDYVMIGAATLGPGEYEARCVASGEPSESFPVSFTVGRVLGFTEFEGFFGSFLVSFGIGSVASLLFVIGLILLIIGLVQRSRSSTHPQGPPGPAGPYTAPPGMVLQPGNVPYPAAPSPMPPPTPPAPPGWSPPSASPPSASPPAAEPRRDDTGGWTIPPSKN